MAEFLKSNATQFDSMANNSTLKNLQILTGTRPYEGTAPTAETV